MRVPLAGLSSIACVALGCLGALGCGSDRHAGVAPRHGQAATPTAKTTLDRDKDSEFEHNHDDDYVTRFGTAALPAQRRVIVATVERYYAATAARDGNKACSLLASFWAKGMAEQAPAGTSPASRCAAGVSAELEHLVPHTDAARTSVDVAGVRVRHDAARVVLHLLSDEERYMRLARERGTWKIDSLLSEGLE